MIIDHIANSDTYQRVGQRIHAGLGFLSKVTLDGFSERRQELDGDKLFAIFLSYQTKPAGLPFEAHNRYIDIQFVVDGEEMIRVAPRGQLSVHTPYNSANDVELYHPGDSIDLVLRSGQFAVLFPHEAHLPQVHPEPPTDVRKVVVKVLV